MTIHKEGHRILLSVLIILIASHLSLLHYSLLPPYGYALFGAATLLLYAFLVNFFRNPSRNVVPQDHTVCSPADGKVVVIQEVMEGEYLKEKRIQVSIFMSPLDVHVNRSPITGAIKFRKHHPGKYLVAWHPKSSTKNERTTLVVENKQGTQILFRQIAGAVARRIKCYPKEGDYLRQGQEYGFIKFGSRADVFLPLDADIKVSLGDRVQGGLSVLATL